MPVSPAQTAAAKGLGRGGAGGSAAGCIGRPRVVRPAVLSLQLAVHVAAVPSAEAAGVPSGESGGAATTPASAATSEGGEAVPTPVAVDRAWIDARVAEANRVFTPFGVAFTVQSVVTLDARLADAAERSDRDALATLFSEGAIHVFVVTRLMDIHTAGLPRRGVHWKVKRAGGAAPARFVIVAGYSGVGVLAHELGHFLGHASHTNSPDNLMSYIRTGLRVTSLTEAQGKAMARRARALLRSGYLKPGPVPAQLPGDGGAPKTGSVAPAAGASGAPD